MTAAEVREVLEVLGESFGATADSLTAEIVRASIIRDALYLALTAVIAIAFVAYVVPIFKKHGGIAAGFEWVFDDGVFTVILPGAVVCGLCIAWFPTFLDLIRWLISPRGEAILFVINNMGG